MPGLSAQAEGGLTAQTCGAFAQPHVLPSRLPGASSMAPSAVTPPSTSSSACKQVLSLAFGALRKLALPVLNRPLRSPSLPGWQPLPLPHCQETPPQGNNYGFMQFSAVNPCSVAVLPKRPLTGAGHFRINLPSQIFSTSPSWPSSHPVWRESLVTC